MQILFDEEIAKLTKKCAVIRVTRIIPAGIAGIELQRLKTQTRNENVNLQNLFTF